jgi:copper transport protein
MTSRGRIAGALAAAAIVVGLAAPSGAAAHAYLIKTVPAASVVLDAPPPNVQLTYDEAVEPKFAIISVTNSAGNQETMIVSLRPRLAEGWYLIYWRAISVDGHPVSGAFTFAIGPNPGPAPKFSVPKIASSATAPQLLITRWAMFLSVMIAIGLFAFRMLIARPLLRRRPGTSLRAVSIAFVVASVLGLIAIPVYLDFSIADDSLRSVFDVGNLVPLFRVTAFGRGYVDMTLCFALFCVAGWIALWLDRPDRERRSVAELAAITGALPAAAAVLVIPGSSGHAAQQSPRGLSVALDWLHLVTGSLWLGGLVGVLIIWASLSAAARVGGLSVVVPRFSNVALVSVLLLLGTGTWATINHMPALSALWETGYGVAILVKIGLLILALAIAATNLLRSKPEIAAAADGPTSELGPRAARRLRRAVGAEAVIVAGAVFAAAVLSSLAPPPPAFALQSSALAQVGPGKVVQSVKTNGYELQVLVEPNKAVSPDSFGLRITKNGRLVRGASVTLTLNHTEMEMPQQEYQLPEKQPGVYVRSAPALVMVGKWALGFTITPKGGRPFNALILDQADG